MKDPKTDDEIKAILSEEDTTMEALQEAQHSPLNEPVIDRSHETLEAAFAADTQPTDDNNTPLDAPTQTFDTQATEEQQPYETIELDPKAATESAKMLTETLLSSVNVLIGVGGGYLVKIRKDPSFYQFEEVVELLDEQNEKNIGRIKLDEEDMAMLRPLLITILKNKVEKITPEKQLLGVVFTILIKKYQAVQEIRSENEVLYDKLVGIINQQEAAPTPASANTTTEKTTAATDVAIELVDDSVDLEDLVMEEAINPKKKT